MKIVLTLQTVVPTVMCGFASQRERVLVKGCSEGQSLGSEFYLYYFIMPAPGKKLGNVLYFGKGGSGFRGLPPGFTNTVAYNMDGYSR